MGHVLEHIPWLEVYAFLKDMQRIAKPNAPMLTICPDVYKTINLWNQGKMPWWLVESVLEHAEVAPENSQDVEWWAGATHHWNAHEKRVENLIHNLGFTNIENVFNLIPNDAAGKSWHDDKTNVTWPVVGKYYWQLAYRFNNWSKQG